MKTFQVAPLQGGNLNTPRAMRIPWTFTWRYPYSEPSTFFRTREAVSAGYRNGCVTIKFKSGHELSFPIAGNKRLEKGTEEELNAIELSPFGIHWPKLDEDLSFEGIMRGDYGQRSGKP